MEGWLEASLEELHAQRQQLYDAILPGLEATPDTADRTASDRVPHPHDAKLEEIFGAELGLLVLQLTCLIESKRRIVSPYHGNSDLTKLEAQNKTIR